MMRSIWSAVSSTGVSRPKMDTNASILPVSGSIELMVADTLASAPERIVTASPTL